MDFHLSRIMLADGWRFFLRSKLYLEGRLARSSYLIGMA